MAYRLRNKYGKSFCKWTVLVQLIVEDVVTCFFIVTQCIFIMSYHKEL